LADSHLEDFRHLLDLRAVRIHQRTERLEVLTRGFIEEANEYDVLSEDSHDGERELLFHAREFSSGLSRFLGEFEKKFNFRKTTGRVGAMVVKILDRGAMSKTDAERRKIKEEEEELEHNKPDFLHSLHGEAREERKKKNEEIHQLKSREKLFKEMESEEEAPMSLQLVHGLHQGLVAFRKDVEIGSVEETGSLYKFWEKSLVVLDHSGDNSHPIFFIAQQSIMKDGKTKTKDFLIHREAAKDAKVVGVIKKKYKGMLKESLSMATDFTVVFPVDATLRERCLLIIAGILADFLFFENNGSPITSLAHLVMPFVP